MKNNIIKLFLFIFTKKSFCCHSCPTILLTKKHPEKGLAGMLDVPDSDFDEIDFVVFCRHEEYFLCKKYFTGEFIFGLKNNYTILFVQLS